MLTGFLVGACTYLIYVALGRLSELKQRMYSMRQEQEWQEQRIRDAIQTEGDNLMKIYKQLHTEVKAIREQLPPKTN